MTSIQYNLKNLLCFLIILSAYIDAPLLIFGILIPSFATVALAIPLIILMAKSFRATSFIYILLIILLFLLSSTLLSPPINQIEKTLGFIQITAAFLISYSLFSNFTKNRNEFYLTLTIGVIFISAFSFLEVTNITKSISDAFREKVFSADLVTYLYTSSERDILLTGFDRPKVFTAEPSFVSITFFVFTISLLKISPSIRRFWILLFCSIMMIFIMRSPITYIIPFILIYILFFEENIVKYQLLQRMLFLFFILTFFLGYPILLELIGRPINADLSISKDLSSINSQTVRFVLPWLTATDVISNSPIYGAGLSGKSAIEIFSSFGLTGQKVMGTNNIATVFIYFGLVGGIIFFSLIYLFFRKILPKYHLSFMMIAITYSGTIGGFETIRYWLFMFVILTAYKLSEVNGIYYKGRIKK